MYNILYESFDVFQNNFCYLVTCLLRLSQVLQESELVNCGYLKRNKN
jgi:hypothetical protein